MSADHYIAGERTSRIISVCVVLTVVGIVGSIGGCIAYESSVIEKMIAAGTDPLQASCAIRPTNMQCHTVAALAGRKQ